MHRRLTQQDETTRRPVYTLRQETVRTL